MIIPRSFGAVRVLLVSIAVLGLGQAAFASPLADEVEANGVLSLRATHTGAFAGSRCKTNTDCYSRNCVSGRCARQPNGGPCFENNNCASRKCNLKTGTCSGEGLLFPQAECVNGTQCLSGRCLDNVRKHNNFGVPAFREDQNLGGNPSKCDWLNAGQFGCRNDLDCASGRCQSGTCTLVADGGKCLFSAQCVNSCLGSDTGTCGTVAPYSAHPLEICKTDSQCTTGLCDGGATFQRKSLTGSPSGTTYVLEVACVAGKAGDSCAVQSDCNFGACKPDSKSATGSSCQLQPLNATCSDNFECFSQTCIDSKCALGRSSTPCDTGADCYSGSCGIEYDGWCDAVPLFGTCRIEDDCVYNKNVCANGKCLIRDTLPCSNSTECASGNCGLAENNYYPGDDLFCIAASN